MFYEGENQFHTRATDTEHAEHVPRKGWKAFKQPPKRGLKKPPKQSSEQSRKGWKAYEQPAKPSYEQPAKPSYEQPAKPSYEQPAKPSYEQPAKPSYEQPAKPSYEQPAKPSYEQSRNGWKAFKQPPKRGSKQPPKSRSERRRKGHKAEDWTMEAQESTTGPKQSPASKQDSEQPPPKQDHKQPPRESFSNTTRTHTNIMDAITSRTLIEMGFTEEQAYRAIAAISPCTDAQRAVEWLLEHGKKNEPSKVLSQKTSKKIIFENLIRAGYDEVAVRAALLIIGNKQSDYVVEHKVVDWLLRMGVTKSAPTTAKNDTSTPTSAKVSQKNCSEVKLPECVVCLERSVEETIVPCGHMCLCTSCARQMKGTGATCPICRTNIHTTVKVYI
jgi:hypothetical protein